MTIGLFELGCRGGAPASIFFMALYDSLPVYKASYDLLIAVFELVKHFHRDDRYTLGEKLKNETLDLIMHIYRANTVEDKVPVIQKAREHIEMIRLLVRLTKDLHQINIKKFAHVTEKVEDVFKQLTGWQKSQANKTDLAGA